MHFSRLLFPVLLLFNTAKLCAQWSPCELDTTFVTSLDPWGTLVQTIPDDDGGAYFIFYSGNANQLEFKVWCQHLDQAGYRLWGDQGRVVAVSPANQSDYRAMPDGAGGIYVTWRENRFNGPYHNIFGQRFAPDGNRLWGEEGRYLGEDGATHQSQVLSDGSLAVTINPNPDNQNPALTVRKFWPDGSEAFTSPVMVENMNFDLCQLFDDHQGGVVAVWQKYDEVAKARRISADGQLAGGEIQVSTSVGPGQFPHAYICPDGQGGIYAVWAANPGDPPVVNAIHVQRYAADGTPLLPLPYKLVLTNSIYPKQILAARSGGFFVEGSETFARVNAQGVKVWETARPNNINIGLSTFLVETENGSLLAVFTANAMLFFDPQGEILWSKPGNTFFGGSFGFSSVCRTTDGAFVTPTGEPADNDPPVLMAKKWDDEGHQFGTLDSFAGTMNGPDSVTVNLPFLLEINPVAGNPVIWQYTFDGGVTIETVPDSVFVGGDKTVLAVAGLYYTATFWAIVQLGANCFDTTAFKTVVVWPPFSSAHEPDASLATLRHTPAGLEVTLPSTFQQYGDMRLAIFDVAGRLVEDVSDSVRPGNFYRVYPTEHLNAGVYLAVLQIGNVRQTAKFVKVRR